MNKKEFENLCKIKELAIQLYISIHNNKNCTDDQLNETWDQVCEAISEIKDQIFIFNKLHKLE